MIEDALDLNPQKTFLKEIEINKEEVGRINLYIWMNFTETLIYNLLELKNLPPLILCFDDIQNFDEESWDVLKNILKKDYKKLFIILSFRNDHHESGINKQTISQNISILQEILKNKIASKFSLKFFFQGLRPIDTLNIMKKFLTLNSIESNLLYFVHLKSKGNPSVIISILRTLMKNNLIKKNLNNLIITNKANELFLINEFITVDSPQTSMKLNSPILDKLDCREILTLKTASIIGDIFNSNILRKMNPFKDQGIVNEDLDKILTELENKEILYVLDEKNNGQKIYQFVHSFMREVIYQRMTFGQRRELHRIYVEILQNSSENVLNRRHDKFFEKLQSRKLNFHWKLAENNLEMDDDINEEIANKSTFFSNSAKKSVIVQKICYLTIYKSLNALSVLKQGSLVYKSNSFIFWRKKFFVLSFKELRIYDNEEIDEDFSRDTDNFHSCIPLKQIFEIKLVAEKQGDINTAIYLHTGSLLKGKDNDVGLSSLYLSAANLEIIEEWGIYIEFARAKAIYDDFVIKFGKITFPLQKENKIIKKDKQIKHPRKAKFEMNSSISKNPKYNVEAIKNENETLKKLLQEFINKGLLITLSTLIENSNAKTENHLLGTDNNFVKTFNFLFKSKPEQLNKTNMLHKLTMNNASPDLKIPKIDDNFENAIQIFKRKKSVSIDSKPIINRYQTDEVILKKGSFKFENDQSEDIESNDDHSSINVTENIICKNSYLSQNKLERKISILIAKNIKRTSQNLSFDSTNTCENASSFDRLEQKRPSIQSAKLPKQIKLHNHSNKPREKEVEIRLNFEEVKNEVKIENSILKIKFRNFRMYKFFSDVFDDIVPFSATSKKNDISKKCLKIKKRKIKIKYPQKQNIEATSEYIFFENSISVSEKQKGKLVKEKTSEKHAYRN
jgi:hypothetical protein